MLDEIIENMFNTYWHGEDILSSVENMKKQLYKNLTDQMNGFWSGSSAYKIMVNGGFLIDSKSGTKKELTELGRQFIKEVEGNI